MTSMVRKKEKKPEPVKRVESPASNGKRKAEDEPETDAKKVKTDEA